ncbi:hypothetical protein FEM48_Zijuj01G0038200 [Ziziphus jujuba var. spinosa]|uniref:Nudix hydrolase domain-containing protein n=1 Tax=Ziziphus jujuba var. spinosa TaxID=714518 RepID=A0A978VYZ6_ZIZJJ|nr:hypothetical protein FEM48_Zijuj01G0038200 [Ziziphus jujuba var. spinosa]
MGSSSNGLGAWGGSQRLQAMALHFRQQKAPPPPSAAATAANAPKNRAAVLICLFQGDDGDLRVILTKRASTLSSHSGEVALPGGKVEEGDEDDVATAIREAKEEIGLDPCLVNVVTVLEPFHTKRGMLVVPVIGVLSDRKAFNPSPNAAEVEEIFDAPLEMFLKKKFVIWALTAGILIMAASVVYQKPPAFSERRPKFWTGDAARETTSMP